MTLQELQNEVLSLMFETEFDDSRAFIAAVNRALATICTEKDRISEMYIYKHKIIPTAKKEHLSHRGGESIKISLNGKAFSLITSGIGTLIIRDGNRERSINFSKNREIIKGFINTGAVELEFLGEYDYDVFSLCAFDSIRGPQEDDIPADEKSASYDMRRFDASFLSFLDEPRNFKGEKIAGCTVFSSVFKLPLAYEGEIVIKYKRLFKKINDGDLDGTVDISEECEHLLALLIASYLLSDDNSELAMYYMNLYRDGMASVKVYNRGSIHTSYNDVLGWAK